MVPDGGAAGIPLLFIFGFYAFDKPILRGICLAGVVGWMGMFVVMAFVHANWNMLIFPIIIGFG